MTLKISEHECVFIWMNLNLEFGAFKIKWLEIIEIICLIYSFDGFFKYLYIGSGIISKCSDHSFVESLQMFDFNSEEIVFPLGITLELFSVNVSILDLGFSYKVHKFVFCFNKVLCSIKMISSSIDELLIRVVHSISFEIHF